MKSVLLSFLFFAFFFSAHAQSLSEDGKRIEFILTESTTKAEIAKADSLFKAHGIDAKMKVLHADGKLRKVDISVNCAQGKATYKANDAEALKKGIRILVDQSAHATVALAVGPVQLEKE